MDVVFMVDGSDSVSSRDWPKVLKWVTNLVDQVLINKTSICISLISDIACRPRKVFNCRIPRFLNEPNDWRYSQRNYGAIRSGRSGLR